MSKAFTKRNHYNPCFWTALWNESYYRHYCSGQSSKKTCREQVVYALNFRSGKIYTTKVEKVHFHSDWGIAEIHPESMKNFAHVGIPSNTKNFGLRGGKSGNLYLDFEEFFSGMEKMDSYFLHGDRKALAI